MATMRTLDLRGNIMTRGSVERLHEASTEHDWRGRLTVRSDPQLPTGRTLEILRRPGFLELLRQSESPPPSPSG